MPALRARADAAVADAAVRLGFRHADRLLADDVRARLYESVEILRLVRADECEQAHRGVVVREAVFLAVNPAIRLREATQVSVAFRDEILLCKTPRRLALECDERQCGQRRMQGVLAEAAVRILLRAEPHEAAVQRVADLVAEGEIFPVPRERFIGGARECGGSECDRGGEKLAAFHLAGLSWSSSLMENSTGVPAGGTASVLTNQTWSSFAPVRGLLMSAPGYVTIAANVPSSWATNLFS